jgi:hypothetical protein
MLPLVEILNRPDAGGMFAMGRKEQPESNLSLPDEIIEQARQLQNDADRRQWPVGDFLVSVIDELGDEFGLLGIQHPRAWIIKTIANRIGADTSTLRDREVMARFFPRSVRERYDMLTYHQLRACKAAGDRWQDFAEWAATNLPAPVAVIRAKIKNGGELPEQWIARWDRMKELTGELVGDPATPPHVMRAAWIVLFMAEEEG